MGAALSWLQIALRCALGKQFDLVSVRIADINGKAVVLLHRFLGKPPRDLTRQR